MTPRSTSLLWAALAAPLLAMPLAAQSGFVPGELILYSPIVQVGNSPGAILRIDPSTGQASVLIDPEELPPSPGGIAYDPFRERLVYCAAPTVGDPVDLYLLDGAGTATALGIEAGSFRNLAPGAGGKVYMTRISTNPFFHYLDSDDSLNVLMDSTGTQPFNMPQVGYIRAMIFDPGTHSLFTGVTSNAPASCSSASYMTVQRLELSNDGTRVLGITGCVDVVVHPTSSSVPVDFSRAPGGQLMIVTDTNHGGTWPRMNTIDPLTLDVTPFASNSNISAAATDAGTWSEVRGQAVVLDSGENVLRTFSPGEVGPGTILPTSIQVSPAGTFGETATLLEIVPSGCGTGVGIYCEAKLTAAGCLPAIQSLGTPSESAGSGFVISVDNMTPGQFGIFFYGHQGPASVPFQGGLLCVQPVLVRTSPVNSGGVGPCGGQLSIDFNARIASGLDAQLVAGAVVHGQFWFRDPADPVSGTGLSGGVTLTVCP